MPTVPGTPTPPNRPQNHQPGPRSGSGSGSQQEPKDPRHHQPRGPQQRRQPNPLPGYRAIVLVTGALMIYFGTLWLGVVVIGDTPIRSAIMAGLILAIAATGYMFNRRPATPEE